MKNGTILQENATHKAVVNNDRIDIIRKGFEFEELKYDDEFEYSIPLENEDDLFSIFESLEEDMRYLKAEFEN
jgi:hypothetical protein